MHPSFGEFDIETEKVELKSGWEPMDDDGYRWVFFDRAGYKLAECYYTYMKVSGVEKWIGKYYNFQIDIMNQYPTQELDGLCKCVEWVDHMMIGDKFS
jgi:hypothetical protein